MASARLSLLRWIESAGAGYRWPFPLPRDTPDGHVLDTALECRPGSEYDEGAFLYFLAVERSRADRSNDALWLLLVSVEPVPGKPVPVGNATAARLFAGLRLAVRETDVTGWYRQDRIAGAVLSAHNAAPGDETPYVIQQRVDEGLRRQLLSADAHSLRVRLIQLRPPVGNR